MFSTAQKLKEKMLELTKLFFVERNIFQRFVIVYRYIRLLNKDPLAKEILQKIFEDTSEYMGEIQKCADEEEFISVKGEAIYTQDFWIYYTNLEVIYNKMKKMKDCQISEKDEFENLRKLFSKPYSKEMLVLSFKVVNSNVFDKLDRQCFYTEDKPKKGKTYFDKDKSILYIKDQKVKINIQDKITNTHKILKYIFIDNKKNLEDDFFYSEIAESEFEDLEYGDSKNAWQTYHVACRDINLKITKQTNNKITDFLVYNTGKTGKVKLNTRYI